ncbi:hypothetical protein AB1Y20_004259 [Prymnesium parvum]|uniref:Cilia- and flagella-associated protein 126 n=1 Tax=Prymnesium parvum TaxID=97485 RepID=A0AB34J673_PRYPA|eukprot:CAMPEP_0182796556 /NCGR_PEP_ID=MMETSP0006_2-20121128/335_1 /TAXON_ID=97485 /ORGANISM="Prymnesium parvum, Strain Texoma1" /LENGTH=121 /DNA_ID=CAMNT_0024921525 /DNA_START=16 /DNA_END=381 /DNA_ORIENTATION=+
MSSSFSANQFDSAFLPKRLCNWETPAARMKTPVHKGRGFRTKTIVNENGHLTSSASKLNNSFSTGYESNGPKRWPDAQHTPNAPYGGSSSMGYKGISTSYLPISTVPIKNNPDVPSETNFH